MLAYRNAGLAVRAKFLVAVVSVVGGCAVDLSMTEVAEPSHGTVHIVYSGVRRETRRFPDYSSIDARILVAPGERGR